jgi:hypothetical protein
VGERIQIRHGMSGPALTLKGARQTHGAHLIFGHSGSGAARQLRRNGLLNHPVVTSNWRIDSPSSVMGIPPSDSIA